jgi:hypothetical protein
MLSHRLVVILSQSLQLHILGLHVQDQLSHVKLLPLRSLPHLTRQTYIQTCHVKSFSYSLFTQLVLPKLYQRVGLLRQ